MDIETLVDRPDLDKILPKVELVAEDGEPMESNWHLFCMMLLIESIKHQLRGRDDYYAGGNQFIYFDLEGARNRNFRGPDFYFVWGVSRTPIRQYWCVWEEGGKYPDVIIELLSPTTAKEDRTTKKDIYERTFRTPFYYCYDPTTQTLDGWHLGTGGYEPVSANERGWIWCPSLQLWLGTWKGIVQGYLDTWLRFYDGSGQLVLTEAEAERQQVQAARLQAQAAQQEAQAALRASQAALRASQAALQRAVAAEAENAQLRARMAELEKRSDNPEGVQ